VVVGNDPLQGVLYMFVCILVNDLFLLGRLFQLIEQQDPFEYSDTQELMLAVTSDEKQFIPVRRSFDSDILYILGRMLDKVCR
jgi:hypothetical protein